MPSLPNLRRHVPLVVALGVDAVGNGLTLPLLLLFLVHVDGLPLDRSGLVLSGAAILSLPMPALIGLVLPRFGARAVVTAAQLMQGAAMVGFLLSDALAVVAGCALLAALGQRVFWSSVFAMIADTSDTDPDTGADVKDRWFALANTVQNTGFGLGTLALGAVLLLPGDLPYRLAVAVNAASFAVSAVLLLAGRRAAPRPVAAAERDHRVPRPRFLAYVGVNALFAFCSVSLSTALSLYVLSALPVPAWIVGPLLAVNTVLGAVGQLPMLRLTRGFSRVRVLVVAGLVWVGWGVLTAALDLAPAVIVVPGLVLSVLLYATAELLWGPRAMALAAEASPAGQRGTYLSWFQYAFAIANVAAPAAVSVTFSVDPRLPWVVLAAAGAAAALGTVLVTPGLVRKAAPVASVVSG